MAVEPVRRGVLGKKCCVPYLWKYNTAVKYCQIRHKSTEAIFSLFRTLTRGLHSCLEDIKRWRIFNIFSAYSLLYIYNYWTMDAFRLRPEVQHSAVPFSSCPVEGTPNTLEGFSLQVPSACRRSSRSGESSSSRSQKMDLSWSKPLPQVWAISVTQWHLPSWLCVSWVRRQLSKDICRSSQAMTPEKSEVTDSIWGGRCAPAGQRWSLVGLGVSSPSPACLSGTSQDSGRELGCQDGEQLSTQFSWVVMAQGAPVPAARSVSGKVFTVSSRITFRILQHIQSITLGKTYVVSSHLFLILSVLDTLRGRIDFFLKKTIQTNSQKQTISETLFPPSKHYVL